MPSNGSLVAVEQRQDDARALGRLRAVNIWQIFEDRQWDLYHEAWMTHLHALNAEVCAKSGAEPGAGDLARIPLAWGEVNQPGAREPLAAPLAGLRTAAVLTDEWLDCPATFANPAGSRARTPTDDSLPAVETAVAVVWRELTGITATVDLGTEVGARATGHAALARLGERPRPIAVALAGRPAAVEPEDFPVRFIPAGTAKKHLSRDLPRRSLAARRRVRALVDAWAHDTLSAHGLSWTPRVLRNFPDFPWVSPVRRGSTYYPEDCAHQHEKWCVQLLDVLEQRGLHSEATAVKAQHRQNTALLQRAVLGTGPADINATSPDVVSAIHREHGAVLARYGDPDGRGVTSPAAVAVLSVARRMLGSSEPDQAGKDILAWLAAGRKANAERGAFERFNRLDLPSRQRAYFAIRDALHAAAEEIDRRAPTSDLDPPDECVTMVETLINAVFEVQDAPEQALLAAAECIRTLPTTDDSVVVAYVANSILASAADVTDEDALGQLPSLTLSQQRAVRDLIARALNQGTMDSS